MTAVPRRIVAPIHSQSSGASASLVASPHCSFSEQTITIGTKLTVYFLALEHLAHRYPNADFGKHCALALSAELKSLANTNSELFLAMRSFISGMPLDAIAQSFHPKKLKQMMLQVLLNPEAIDLKNFASDPNSKETATGPDLIRDLNYYVALCELCTQPLIARAVLDQIARKASFLTDAERKNFNSAVQSLPFKFVTDRAFCLNKRKTSPIIPLRPEYAITEVKSEASFRPIKDLAFDAIVLFREFEAHSKQLIAEGGETYETLQLRMEEQKKRLQKTAAQCLSIPAEDRESMYRIATATWHTFVRDDRSRQQRLANFLNFLANPV